MRPTKRSEPLDDRCSSGTVRLEIGADPNQHFKLYGASGADLTDEILIKSLCIEADPYGPTRATLVVYCQAHVLVRREMVSIEQRLKELDAPQAEEADAT